MEFEARWIDIDTEKIREKIRLIGGELYHEEKIYNRCIYQHPKGLKGYMRVRQEYDNKDNQIVTMTIKTYTDPKYPTEHEINVDNDYKTANAFARMIGGNIKAEHETKREKYKGVPGCNEIVIDTIPGLNPYVEIDCNSEDTLQLVATQLGLAPLAGITGGYGEVFVQEYGIDLDWINNDLDEIKFSTIAKKMRGYICRNKDKFDEIVNKY